MRRCPTCDGEPTIVKAFGWHYIGCEECELVTQMYFEKDSAIKAWDDMVDEMIRDLDEIMRGES